MPAMSSTVASRNPWPIAIIAFFALFISAAASYIVFAVRQDMDLVRPDYYEEELRYQKQLDRLHRTAPLEASVTVAYHEAGQQIEIRLPQLHAVPTTTGSIHLYRPSDAELDRHLPLALDPAGLQRLDARQLRAGLWKVRIQWTAEGQEFFVDRPLLIGS